MRSFQVVVVGRNHDNGVNVAASLDKVIPYSGATVTVHVRWVGEAEGGLKERGFGCVLVCFRDESARAAER